ncbi:recombinase family protein [Candidatus Bathyarchaeota archaeon]|nr:recombinase family protein [Candidatus Bathyarchaeota archaeon]
MRTDNKSLKDWAATTLFDVDDVENAGYGGLRVAAYVRVSTERQAKQGMSLEAQKDELRKLAKSIGAEKIYWFVDAKTGTTLSGRKLFMILRLAELGLIDKLLVCNIDRLGRDSCDLLGFMLQLRALGITTVTPEEEIDLKRLGDMIKTAVSAITADKDNRSREYAAMRSKIYNFKNKRWNIPIPLGYKKSGTWIAKDPEYQPLITSIFDRFLMLKDYGKVARYVNQRYRHLLKKMLKGQDIAKILTNPVYIGRPRCTGEKMSKLFGKVEVIDENLAFVKPDVFQKVSEIVAKKTERYRRKEKPAEKLTKLLGTDILECFDEEIVFKCPICGEIMKYNGQAYRCRKCGKSRKLIKKRELIRIAEWIIKREKVLKNFIEIAEKNGCLSQLKKKYTYFDKLHLDRFF